MRPARPMWQEMQDQAFGLAALLLAVLVPASAWMVAQAALLVRPDEDGRRVEFVRATAGIQTGVQLLRQLEKSAAASAASRARGTYYRERREEARRRIGELSRSAAAIAEGAEERARLEQLAVLVRVADARHAALEKRNEVVIVQR